MKTQHKFQHGRVVAKFNLGKKYKYAEHTEKLLMVIRQKRIVLVIKKTQTGNIEKNIKY